MIKFNNYSNKLKRNHNSSQKKWISSFKNQNKYSKRGNNNKINSNNYKKK